MTGETNGVLLCAQGRSYNVAMMLSSLFKKQRAVDTTMNELFGPPDNDDALTLLASFSDPDRVLSSDEVRDALEQYPLSHNMRLFALSWLAQHEEGESLAILALESLALFPNSPLILKGIQRRFGNSMNMKSLEVIDARIKTLSEGIE